MHTGWLSVALGNLPITVEFLLPQGRVSKRDLVEFTTFAKDW
jgi:hypothetical protein